MRLLVLVALACGGAPRPTVTGAELYSRVEALHATGAATVGAITIRREQMLVRDGQTFVVSQVIENCRGGDAAHDLDCALALLLDQRFTVVDHAPDAKSSAHGEDRSGSALSAVAVVALGVAATGGLVYGVATCSFPGCKAVFGVPLVFIGGAALFMLGKD